MNVRTVCLAILNFREATGYEIKKLSTESHYAHFVDASFGSIYPALNKLEAEGLVTQREERAPGKPPRKVYSITGAGRAALLEQLAQPPREDTFRSEFLMVALCAHQLDRATVRRAIEANLAQMRAKLDMVESIADAERHLPTATWVTDFARHCISAHIAFLESGADRLAAMAGGDGAPGLSEAAE